MIAVIISLYILVLVSESVSTILLALHLVSKVSRKSGINPPSYLPPVYGSKD